jgi:hypothetical protein
MGLIWPKPTSCYRKSDTVRSVSQSLMHPVGDGAGWRQRDELRLPREGIRSIESILWDYRIKIAIAAGIPRPTP